MITFLLHISHFLSGVWNSIKRVFRIIHHDPVDRYYVDALSSQDAFFVLGAIGTAAIENR
jgi:hypothetical protein